MSENLNLVADLALIFISAGIITLIFRWLKQPLILGYIVAGFLVGPHFGLFPNVTNEQVVEQWSEIGIIFLLFALGLEFSFKKLLNVGSSALITAGTIFVGMFCIGLGVGNMLGWTMMESIFLGGMLSMSSTTIIIKAFDDLGLKNKSFTTVVFGTPVVEDLLAILLMVLLSTLAVSKHFAGKEMLMNMLKLGFFLILWFLVGIYVIPSLLRKAHKIMNEEMLLILSVGLCFGMVVLAGYVGFSSALGAFIMGSILAETIEGERISKTVKGIKDLFGAIFFVSVGMMVDPAIIVQYWKPILILVIVVVTFIPLFATCGILLSGKGLMTAVRSGFSMAQIGEFAFIIAALGASLGVMSGFIYPVVVAVSVITTFTTPYFIKMSGPFSVWLSKKLPASWMKHLDEVSSLQKPASRKNDWKNLLNSYFVRVLLYSVMLFAICFASFYYLYPFLTDKADMFGETTIKWICTLATIAVMSPFLYGMVVTRGKLFETFGTLWNDKTHSNKGPLIALILLRVFIAVAFFLSVLFFYFDFSFWIILIITLGATLVFLLARRNIHRFEFLETRFFRNLNQKEEMEMAARPITSSVKSKLTGRDIHLESVVVSPNSRYIGMQLKYIPFRRDFGVNIVKIVRGSKTINIPSADEYIYPSDTILAIGTSDQIKRFMEVMEADANVLPADTAKPSVESFVLTDHSYLTGKTLIKAGMRNSGCMIIGVDRGKESIMNPSPDFLFQTGDVVWMVGDKVACEWYM